MNNLPKLEKIGDYCQVGDGAHTSIKRKESGVLYLSSKNFKDGKLDLSKVSYISETDFQKHFKDSSKSLTKTKHGDVALSIIGTIGEPYIIKKKDIFGISSAVAFLRSNDRIKTIYLYYWLKSTEFQQAIFSIKGGVAQGYVSLEMIRSLPLKVFELNQQETIAFILSTYDNLIENNNCRIAILEEMAQSLYREWFVKFRFPEHEQAKFVDSSLGRIPEGWEVKKLAEIAKVNPDGITKRNAPANIWYIDISSVGTGVISEYKKMTFADAPSRARRIIQDNDIVWATVRPNRKQYSYISKPLKNTIVSTGFAVLRSVNVPSSFLYRAITTDDFTNYLVNNASGSAYPAVNAKDFENADILVPHFDLITKFSNLAFNISTQQQILLNKNKNLKLQRDFLLPKLISGKINLDQ
ncbi:MAG: restriction endonuclease subunit S [Methylococcales bacterium]|jgi:type I restriction enzyme, S subunit|nr:restriction endonuclease subunit S [Methylococcales bacterium]MBT7409708.1 restriction endonuclease subunit S [Methylococcales bacterium]